MFRSIVRLFVSAPAHRPTVRRATLGVETLEGRVVPAAFKGTVNYGAIHASTAHQSTGASEIQLNKSHAAKSAKAQIAHQIVLDVARKSLAVDLGHVAMQNRR